MPIRFYTQPSGSRSPISRMMQDMYYHAAVKETYFTVKKSFYLNLSFKKATKLQNGFPCSPFSETFPHGNDVTEGQYGMQENCTIRIKRSNSVDGGGATMTHLADHCLILWGSRIS